MILKFEEYIEKPRLVMESKEPEKWVKSLKKKYAFGLPSWGQFRRLVAEKLNKTLDAKFNVPQEYIDAYKKTAGR